MSEDQQDDASVEELRKKLGSTPVRLGHVPDVIVKQVAKRFPPLRDDRGRPLRRTLEGVAEEWLQNWGSTEVDGRECLVTEFLPRFGRDVCDAISFAWNADLEYEVSVSSWWSPGKAVRVRFWYEPPPKKKVGRKKGLSMDRHAEVAGLLLSMFNSLRDLFVEQLKVHPKTVRRWSEEGRFPPPLRIGSTVRYSRTAVDNWLAQQHNRQNEVPS